MALMKPTGRPLAAPAPQPVLEALLGQLAVGDASARRGAARDLAAHSDAASHLAQRLEPETDSSVRSVIFTSLARIGGDAAVQCLLPLLRSEDAALRNGAIEVLGGQPQAVAPCVEALLADADSDVRIFAVNLLGQLPHERVPQWLAQVLRVEAEPNVVGAALDVAAEVAVPDMAAPLREVAARFPKDPFIAFAAGLALRRIESA